MGYTHHLLPTPTTSSQAPFDQHVTTSKPTTACPRVSSIPYGHFFLPLGARITHLWVCIDQRAQDWGHRAPLPDVFLGYLEMHLNALDQDPNHDLERFEIEWDTSDNPWPAGPFCFAPTRPWQRLRRARRYGYVVGKKVSGMWNVRFFDQRGQGFGYKWNEGKVDDMDPVDSFTDARIRVRRLLNLVTEEFWFQ